jgi:hypothetical protein
LGVLAKIFLLQADNNWISAVVENGVKSASFENLGQKNAPLSRGKDNLQ